MALHVGRNASEETKAKVFGLIARQRSKKQRGGKTMRNDEREDGNRDVDWKKEGFVNQEL